MNIPSVSVMEKELFLFFNSKEVEGEQKSLVNQLEGWKYKVQVRLCHISIV
jgi:hypothetical protein